MFSFGASPTVSISFADEESAARPKKQVRAPHQGGANPAEPETLLIYGGKEDVKGTVQITVPPGSKIDHMGIKIEMIAHIEVYLDKGNNIRVLQQTKELDSAGTLQLSKSYNFEFSFIEKPYESYYGINVRLRYFMRVTITRKYNTVVKERDFCVHIATAPQQAIADTPQVPIKMEVGIEDCLHIEFEYDRSRYHLQDVILGKIYFLLVKIKIKHMELAVIRKEKAGQGPNPMNESENVAKYELMDGAPVKGECVPIRLFLEPLDLTPTYKLVNQWFSVKYFLNLVLVDEEDRRYFKQQEVIFWRRGQEEGQEKNL